MAEELDIEAPGDEEAALRAALAAVLGLPVTVGAGNILFATAANTVGSSNDFNFNGTSFLVTSPGPHAIGGAVDNGTQIFIQGTFPERTGVNYSTVLQPPINANTDGVRLEAGFDTAASGTHPALTGVSLGFYQNVLGGAAVTDVHSVYARGGDNWATTSTANTSIIKIQYPHSGATANYSFWDASTGGNGARFDNTVGFNAHVTMSGTSPGVACGTDPSITGSDNASIVTVGSGGVATACVITFATEWDNPPACISVSDTDAAPLTIATTTTTATITKTTPFTAGSKLHVLCMGN